MQITSNYSYSPNFGMAMKIEEIAYPAIEKGGKKLLDQLEKAAEIVGAEGEENATKMVHLVIGKNAVPTVQTPFANQYTKHFEPEMSKAPWLKEFLQIKTVWAGKPTGYANPGDPYTAVIQFENAEAAKKVYNQMKNAGSEIERGAILTRVLDDKYVVRNKKQVDEFLEFRRDFGNLIKRLGQKD